MDDGKTEIEITDDQLEKVLRDLEAEGVIVRNGDAVIQTTKGFAQAMRRREQWKK